MAPAASGERLTRIVVFDTQTDRSYNRTIARPIAISGMTDSDMKPAIRSAGPESPSR